MTEFIERARAILRDNDLGGYTIPTKRLYPFQWNWDSGFAALGFSTFDEPRAWQELEMLFIGQWQDGLLPHIVFHKVSPDYFPGPGDMGRRPAAADLRDHAAARRRLDCPPHARHARATAPSPMRKRARSIRNFSPIIDGGGARAIRTIPASSSFIIRGNRAWTTALPGTRHSPACRARRTATMFVATRAMSIRRSARARRNTIATCISSSFSGALATIRLSCIARARSASSICA